MSRLGSLTVSIVAEPVLLRVDIAIPCGQIVTELMTNAFNHAFPDGRRGTVTVALVTDAIGVILSVSDDGIGFRESTERAQATSLGLRLVGLLTEQLGATLSIRRSDPTRFIFQFPCEECQTPPPSNGAQEPPADA
jgi:two-component sensor histidine kinase